MKSKLLILLLSCAHFAAAQNPLDIKVVDFGCNESLSKCLDTLSVYSGVFFNYKNADIEGTDVYVPAGSYSLAEVLSRIQTQCDLSYKVINEKSIVWIKNKGVYVLGSLVDILSGEPIVNASIYVKNDQKLYKSDQFGIFRFYTAHQHVSIIIKHHEYQVLETDLTPQKGKSTIVRLKPISVLSAVEVEEREGNRLSLRAFDEVNPAILSTPSVGGEADALNSVKLLPGVQNITFGTQGLQVRGGSPDQNGIMLDGIPVYKTFHLLGLFSIFNPSSINSVRVYKDAFPSKFNNRLSSVIDIGLKNGNKQKLEATANIGVLSSGIFINGPIVKNKLSFSASARRTYADVIALPLQDYQNRGMSKKVNTSLWSYDLFAKLHYQVNDKNQINLSAYNGGDQLNIKTRLNLADALQTEEQTDAALGWRNNLIGIGWNSTWGSRIFLRMQNSVSTYAVHFSDAYTLANAETNHGSSSSFSNGLQDIRSTLDVDIAWNKSNMLNVGVGNVFYSFSPFSRIFNSFLDENSTDTALKTNEIVTQERFVYLENKSYFEGGNVTYGARISSFRTGGVRYNRFQPKLLLIQNINKKMQLRFGLLTSNQFLHLVPNNNLGLPVDIWLPVTANQKPMSMTQLTTKVVYRLSHWKTDFSVFSKFYNRLLEQPVGAQFITENNWESDIYSGSGRAYGAEYSIGYKHNKLAAFGAYTFCRNKRTVEGVNDGVEYFSKYDRPHTLSIMSEYKLTPNDRLVLTFNYTSGNPTTVPSSRYIVEINGREVVLDEYSKINNYRLPATHHLDISYVRERQHNKFRSKMVLGVYNVYNRYNPFMLFIGLNENAETSLKLRSYLPILPMLKYEIKI